VVRVGWSWEHLAWGSLFLRLCTSGLLSFPPWFKPRSFHSQEGGANDTYLSLLYPTEDLKV